MGDSKSWATAEGASRYFQPPPPEEEVAKITGRVVRKKRGRKRAAPRGKLWKKVEQPFHSVDRMVRDCQQAIDDPSSWLTCGYTAALHLRFVLEQQGHMRPNDWSFADDEELDAAS